MIRSANAQRRGLATLMWLAVPLVLGGTTGWWYVQHQLPFVNKTEFVAPIAVQRMTIRHDAKGSGHFGAPRSGARHHSGVDLLGKVGDPVYAVRSGWVREARFHKGFGYYVEIDHGHAFTTLYAHLSRMDVRRGDRVRQGQRIGSIGKSGNARSKLVEAHLHFELRQNGEPIDPLKITFFYARIVDPVHPKP